MASQEETTRDESTASGQPPPCATCPYTYRKGKVAKSFPYRIHILKASNEDEEPHCDCSHLHMTYGKNYRYCTCGESQTQPFCNDACSGTDWEPMKFTVDKNQTWYLLCGCKQTETPPHCDGSHIHIDWSKVNDW